MLAIGEQKYPLYDCLAALRCDLMIMSAFLFKGLTSDQISLSFPPPYLNSLELGNGSLHPAPFHGGGETGSAKCFCKRILINNIKEDSGQQKISRPGRRFESGELARKEPVVIPDD